MFSIYFYNFGVLRTLVEIKSRNHWQSEKFTIVSLLRGGSLRDHNLKLIG